MDEFALIKRYFQASDEEGAETTVELGIGDDCALLTAPDSGVIAVSMDTLVEGVHFPVDVPADMLAERSLRVNLSDLAAMGAKPLWMTLALTLPEVDTDWLQQFSQGLSRVAKKFGVSLVGGDTTRGPLAITIQVHGVVEPELALRRSNARVGDRIFVTGPLGDGAAGLEVISESPLVKTLSEDHRAYLRACFYQPEPRLKEGLALLGIANAAIDISDGLLADLGHICNRSGVGADVEVGSLPISESAALLAGRQKQIDWALSGGDDYELCFTVSPSNLERLAKKVEAGLIQPVEIGQIIRGSVVKCISGVNTYTPEKRGYNHFSAST